MLPSFLAYGSVIEHMFYYVALCIFLSPTPGTPAKCGLLFRHIFYFDCISTCWLFIIIIIIIIIIMIIIIRTVQGSNAGEGEIFRTPPDGPSRPPTLVYSG